MVKPTPDQTTEARAKGGRASGGTRYYCGKSNGEDKMVRLMQQALDDKKEQERIRLSLEDLSVDELIAVLEFSCEQTERFIREVEKNVFGSRCK